MNEKKKSSDPEELWFDAIEFSMSNFVSLGPNASIQFKAIYFSAGLVIDANSQTPSSLFLLHCIMSLGRDFKANVNTHTKTHRILFIQIYGKKIRNNRRPLIAMPMQINYNSSLVQMILHEQMEEINK